VLIRSPEVHFGNFAGVISQDDCPSNSIEILKVERKEEYTEIRELWGLEPISLMIKKGRL